MKFRYEIAENVLILTFEENLIGSTADPSLIQTIDELQEEGMLQCAIDLSEIDFINSAGLGLLMRILAKFRKKGGDIMLINPSENIQKLLIITKLSAIFTIVQSVQNAISIFKTDRVKG